MEKIKACRQKLNELKKIGKYLIQTCRKKKILIISRQLKKIPSTGFELTPLIHCSTILLALRPAPWTTLPRLNK